METIKLKMDGVEFGDEVISVTLPETCETITCTEKAKLIIQGLNKWEFGGSK